MPFRQLPGAVETDGQAVAGAGASANSARQMAGQMAAGSIGRGGRIRTGGPLRPRQVRYQAALRPDSRLSLILTPIGDIT